MFYTFAAVVTLEVATLGVKIPRAIRHVRGGALGVEATGYSTFT